MPTPFEPTWESLANFTIPDWYPDAKFGIFIHWGIYSVPAFDNEWYSRNMYLQNNTAFEHHQEVWGAQSKFGYKDFIPMFKAEKFDPDAWMSLLKEAGARYVVPVAEHHDGFAMYDSDYSDWTATKMGPKRDIIGELANAARAQDLVFGLSSHRAEHWWFMNGGRDFDSDVQDPAYDDFYGPAKVTENSRHTSGDAWQSRDWQPRPHAKFLEDWLARCTELVDKYQPQLYYFDWWIRQLVFEPYLQRFAAYYYNRGAEWNKGVAINCKNEAYPDGTVVFDVERGQLGDIRYPMWQTDTSVSKTSWSYVENHDYKETSAILHDLIDIVSKNGNLLLDIGPKADGTIPEVEQAMLREIGGWLATNGEAIYGSRPWKKYGEGPTQVVAGEFSDTKREAFTSKDVRFTTQGDTVYAMVMGTPEEGTVAIESLGSDKGLYTGEINKVSLLGSESALSWTQSGQALTITLPQDTPSTHAITFKVEA